MIFYISSYPRSGNSWIQQLIVREFQHLTTDDGDARSASPNWDAFWELTEAEAAERDPALVWNEWTRLYREKIATRPTGRIQRRFLMPGFFARLKPGEREALAREPTAFFVKTHSEPLASYHPGEFVIHIIRHPGPVCLSYLKLLDKESEVITDNLAKLPFTMAEVITGQVPFGSWTDHTRRWLKTGADLGARYLMLSYEELLTDPTLTVQRIAGFTGLPWVERVGYTLTDKKALNAGFPGDRGKNLEYEKFFTVAQLQLVTERHGALMQELGYTAPDTRLAAGDTQINLLAQAVERLRRKLTETVAALTASVGTAERHLGTASELERNLAAAGVAEAGLRAKLAHAEQTNGQLEGFLRQQHASVAVINAVLSAVRDSGGIPPGLGSELQQALVQMLERQNDRLSGLEARSQCLAEMLVQKEAELAVLQTRLVHSTRQIEELTARQGALKTELVQVSEERDRLRTWREGSLSLMRALNDAVLKALAGKGGKY